MEFLGLMVSVSHGYSACLVVWLVKNLPVMQEILVQFLGQEDPLEKGEAGIPGLLLWLSW